MTDRAQILDILHFALRQKSGIKWGRNTEMESQAAAGRILAHLELSNVKMQMGQPASPHSTPGDPGHKPGDVPFSRKP